MKCKLKFYLKTKENHHYLGNTSDRYDSKWEKINSMLDIIYATFGSILL